MKDMGLNHRDPGSLARDRGSQRRGGVAGRCADDEDGAAEAEDVDGWSDTDCTVTGWLEGLGLGEPVAARAVPAATTEIAAAALHFEVAVIAQERSF